jgi:diguanylate cyclase (GGDEF)-like protein
VNADAIAQLVAGPAQNGVIVSNAEAFFKMLALALFAGFFGAMALVNVIAAWVLRSLASAAYAALMAVMTVLMLYSLGRGDVGGEVAHAVLIALYMAATVGFAFALLRTWRYDRPMGWIVSAILAANMPLVFLELLRPGWLERFYALDQFVFDALLVALVVLGVRALAHSGTRVAGAYLAAFVLPAIGAVLNDLATNHVLAKPFEYSFEVGVAWEAMFFAFAVAMRNRGVQSERDRYERLASIDGLTGVANRRTFDGELERMWSVARRGRVSIAIVMIDIDLFKALNDARGHQAGDDCLRRVASLCAGTLRRSGDCFARYGGEEFAAILFNADLAAAESLAGRVREAVEHDGEVTVSLGVAAAVPRANDEASAVVAAADAALYRAKAAGRNCVRAAISIGDDPGIVRPPDLRSERP